MAVSRKAMTEGIRTPIYLSILNGRGFTIPQSKIKDFCQLPLHKGAGVLPHQYIIRWFPQKKKPKADTVSLGLPFFIYTS